MTEPTPKVCVAVEDLLTVIDLATCNPYMGDYDHDLTALDRLRNAITGEVPEETTDERPS